jgi:phosphoserine phosphatase
MTPAAVTGVEVGGSDTAAAGLPAGAGPGDVPIASSSRAASQLSASQLTALLDVTRHLAAPFELHTMLQQVAAAACAVLDAERASVWLLDEAAGELWLEVSSDLPPIRVALGRGLVGACAATRLPLNVPDCYADVRFNPAMDQASGFVTRCSLSLPLLDHQDALVGVLQVLNRRDGPFDSGHVALGTALAAQCAVALSRVRLAEATLAARLAAERLRQELVLASQVQQATLPTAMPDLPGWDMHGAFFPAEQTGGDTYDLALTPQGQLLVVLADATGHGIAPALSVTQMHAMLRMAMRLGAPLEQAFTQVNDQLAQTLPDGRFVTAAIGLLDPATARLRLLSGGQGPILHWHAARGECSVHRATSFPMGAAPISRLKPALELDFAPGDWLVLLSDGIYEQAGPGGELFGRDRVVALLQQHHTDSAAALGQALLQAVRDFAAEVAQDDDITVVLLRRLP